MKRVVLRGAEVLVFPTIVLVVVLVLAPGRAALAVHVYVLVLLAAGARVRGRIDRRSGDTRVPHRSTPHSIGRREERERLPELMRLEREVALAQAGAVRPALPPAAGYPRDRDAGCSSCGGASISTGNPSARATLLGDETFELVRADREPPWDRLAVGPDTRRAPARGGRGWRRSASMQLAELHEQGARILDEVERAVVGKRERLELVLLGLLADGHVLLEDFPGLAKTLAARSFATVTSLDFAPHPVHARPDAVRRHRLVDLEPARRRLRLPAGADLHQPAARRRDQPRPTEDAGGAARGDAGAAGDDRGHHARARAPVPRARDPEPDRVRGHLPAARRPSSTASCSGPGSATRAPRTKWEVLERRIERREDDVQLEPVVDRETLLAMQRAVEDVHVAPERRPLHRRARRRDARPARAPRSAPARAARSRCSSSRAAGRRSPGRDFVTPDDVKAVAVPALAHRLVLKPELWVQRLSAEDVVRDILDAVPTPPAEDVTARRMTRRASPRVVGVRRRSPHSGCSARSRCAGPSWPCSRRRSPALLALGLATSRPPELGLWLTVARERAHRGRRGARRRSSCNSEAAGRDGWRSLLVLPAGLETGEGENPVSVRLRRGGASGRSSSRCAATAGELRARRRVSAGPRSARALPLGRSACGAPHRLRVYPSPERLQRMLAPLETQAYAGNQVARVKGDGLEFADTAARTSPATGCARSTGGRAPGAAS